MALGSARMLVVTITIAFVVVALGATTAVTVNAAVNERARDERIVLREAQLSVQRLEIAGLEGRAIELGQREAAARKEAARLRKTAPTLRARSTRLTRTVAEAEATRDRLEAHISAGRYQP